MSQRLLQLFRPRPVRLALHATWILVPLVLAVLAIRHFSAGGWPLTDADPVLLGAASVAFLVGWAFKAFGWNRLFVPAARPGALALATASGAASVAGVALPGRFDDAVRIAVVRRHPGCPAGIPALGVSLVMLGLVDAAALAPASFAAALTTSAGASMRVAFGLVAGAGLAAALAIAFLPRLIGTSLLGRFRVVRWLRERKTSGREACEAWFLVSASWLVRGLGVLLLLAALGSGISIPLALAYLCASAASAALPVAPAGAATQAGAGAAVLIASGIPAGRAVALALGTQLLVVLAGAAVALAGASWVGGRRLGRRLLPAAG